jgi:hypothetical protein
MANMRPLAFFFLSLVLLWIGTSLGSRLRKRYGELMERDSKMIGILNGAVLTLFGLLLGFTFSMAVSRYDLRKELIVTEANAIGTTWLRTATLEEPTRSREQSLLRQYVPERVNFLPATQSEGDLRDELNRTSDLQAQLWAVAASYAAEHKEPITGLYLSTLNASIDATEKRAAANENRIPTMAWLMLLFISFAGMVLVGMNLEARSIVLEGMLPLVLAASMMMTLDLDSPRYGFIRLDQPSMDRLAQQVAGSLPQTP